MLIPSRKLQVDIQAYKLSYFAWFSCGLYYLVSPQHNSRADRGGNHYLYQHVGSKCSNQLVEMPVLLSRRLPENSGGAYVLWLPQRKRSGGARGEEWLWLGHNELKDLEMVPCFKNRGSHVS